MLKIHDENPLKGAAAVMVVCALVACNRSASESEAPPVESKAASSAASNSAGVAVPATTEACAPFEELAALDHRQPVPLQPMMAWHQKQNMMQHLVAIQGIADALAREAWDEVAAAAKAIESSPQMQQMCEHMGAGADGFTELALEFHRRADEIGKAALARDASGVLRATAKTLESCTGCHAGYKQQVVDSATWTALTGQTLGH